MGKGPSFYTDKSKFCFPYGFYGGADSKESTCNVGNLGSIPGSGRSLGEGNGYQLQYSCLENSMDRGAWQATVHGLQRVGYDCVCICMLTLKMLGRNRKPILDAWGWCTGTTQRDGMGREEGGGLRMGNTCIPVADSF